MIVDQRLAAVCRDAISRGAGNIPHPVPIPAEKRAEDPSPLTSARWGLLVGCQLQQCVVMNQPETGKTADPATKLSAFGSIRTPVSRHHCNIPDGLHRMRTGVKGRTLSARSLTSHWPHCTQLWAAKGLRRTPIMRSAATPMDASRRAAATDRGRH